MHPFKQFLERRGLTQAWAIRRARELQERLSQGFLSDVLAGKETPGLRVMGILERLTDGEVKAEEIARWHLGHPAAANVAA